MHRLLFIVALMVTALCLSVPPFRVFAPNLDSFDPTPAGAHNKFLAQSWKGLKSCLLQWTEEMVIAATNFAFLFTLTSVCSVIA